MIVILELENFIKEIEEKSKRLTGDSLNNSRDKIVILQMAIKEIRDSYRLTNDAILECYDSEKECLILIQENRLLKNRLIELENLINHLDK